MGRWWNFFVAVNVALERQSDPFHINICIIILRMFSIMLDQQRPSLVHGC